MSIPTIKPPVTAQPAKAPAATSLEPPKASPAPMPAPAWGMPYPYGYYGMAPWGYYPPPLPPPPAPATPAAKPAETVTKAAEVTEEKPVEKAAPKAKTADEKLEDEILDAVRELLKKNPQIKANLTPEMVQQLKRAANDPSQLKDMVLQGLASSPFGERLKKAVGTGWTSKLLRKAALNLSPTKSDPWVEEFFNVLQK